MTEPRDKRQWGETLAALEEARAAAERIPADRRDWAAYGCTLHRIGTVFTTLTVLVERRGYVSDTVAVAFEADGERPVVLVKSAGRRRASPVPPTKPAGDRPLYLDPTKIDGVIRPH